jgi:hydroxymethylbilane synthase
MRIGTRGSALALAQARLVADKFGSGAVIVPVTTSGDLPAPHRPEDKSRWVKELEQALLAREIDVAVHSAKDVPAELPDGLELVAIPERADPRDAICGAASLRALAPGATVATSSLRRAAQIRAAREDLEIVPVRGNVDTRLRKLADGSFDALVLALAGLQRLGRAEEAGGVLDQLVPAAGQGALALEARAGEEIAGLERCSDPIATACVTAERALVHALGASCNTPVGAHAQMADDGQLELRGWVGLPDGSAWLCDRLRHRSADAQELGLAVAERMIAAGASELLRDAEAMVA